MLPTTAATGTAASGLGVMVRTDPDWVACPPTRPAEHTPAQNKENSRKGSTDSAQLEKNSELMNYIKNLDSGAAPRMSRLDKHYRRRRRKAAVATAASPP